MMRRMGDHGDFRTKWTGWLHKHWGELNYLILQREIVHDTLLALERQRHNNTFGWMLFQMYVRYQSIGVRRLIDRGRDTYSLHRLLDEALDHREKLVREDFVRAWVEHNPTLDAELMTRSANECYDTLWGEGVDVPTAAAIAADMRKLAEDTNAVRKFANWTQAHMIDKEPDPLGLAELEQAVDDVI